MGSNNKKNEPNAQYGSGGDPRGRVQNQSAHQQQRYEQQQGPMVNAFAQNYGRGSESDFQNYDDIMGQFRGMATGGRPEKIGYKDPFKSYGGYEEFSKTGGYSAEDIANMRARGVSPIRAAYANAERELDRGKSLQGGYSPNMAAAQVKMAREQGQAGADAIQNVEGGLAEARNRGRLAGLGGMSNIEGQRLNADLDVGKFNVLSGLQSDQMRLGAAQGMAGLYGTTPGMSSTFGNQLLQGVGQGGTFGLNLMGRDTESQNLPGSYEQTMGRTKDILDTAGRWANPVLDWYEQRRQQKKQPAQTGYAQPEGGY